MKNLFILAGFVLTLFSCSKETTEVIDIVDPVVADDVMLKIEALEKDGRVTELFSDDANMDYLQSEDFAYTINHVLEIKQDTKNKKILVRNLAPLNLGSLSILATFPDIDEQVVILKLDQIKAHTLLSLDYPFDQGIRYFETISGKRIDLSGLEGQNPIMSFDYDPGKDPLLMQLHVIKSVWKIKFHDFDELDSEGNNWEENMTPKDLRRYTGLMINLAYLFQSPEFKEGLLAENLFDDALVVKTQEEKLEILNQLFNKDRFNCGKVVNVSGLGGGSTFGVAEHVLNRYLTSVSNIGDIPVHEVGHMLGFGHASNFTYPKENEQGIKEGFVIVAQRVAEKFFNENRFPVRPDNYYKISDL